MCKHNSSWASAYTLQISLQRNSSSHYRSKTLRGERWLTHTTLKNASPQHSEEQLHTRFEHKSVELHIAVQRALRAGAVA